MASDLEITLKRYNGTDYDTLKPTTTWAQIEGKPTTFTPTSHTHTISQISDAGNLGDNLMALQNTSNATRFIKFNPDHSISVESGSTFRTSIDAAASSHTHTLANITDSGAAAAYGVIDSTTNAAIGTGTSLPTERDVYYGLVAVNGSSQSRATTIYAPTSAGSAYQTLRSSGSGAPVWVEPLEEVGSTSQAVNNYGSIAFTSGMRNFYIEAQQDGTTGLYQIAKFYVTMENSYSLSTSSRYYRATWFNGSSALTITFQYYYSGTTFYIRHTGPTVTIGYRLYNLK